jgi:hypothetical protein
MQKEFYFSEQHHSTAIKEINVILERLKLPFIIDMKTKY